MKTAIDPRNNGIAVSTAEIARTLSTPKRKIHRRTVSRALKRLDQLGFLDLEIVAAQVKLHGGGLWSADSEVGDRPNCGSGSNDPPRNRQNPC